MKNRSELREVIMKVIYQVNIFEETNLEYDINDLIKEQLEEKVVRTNDETNEKFDEFLDKYQGSYLSVRNGTTK